MTAQMEAALRVVQLIHQNNVLETILIGMTLAVIDKNYFRVVVGMKVAFWEFAQVIVAHQFVLQNNAVLTDAEEFAELAIPTKHALLELVLQAIVLQT